MPTWEEILNQSYNPVTAVRDSHRALLEKRQAENLARMRAANPGYNLGGFPQTNQGFQQFAPSQGFQQFAPPSVMSNQDDWLTTQFELANQHLGGLGDPSAVGQVSSSQSAASGGNSSGNNGQGGGGGEFGGTNRGGSFGGMAMSDMPGDLSSAISNAQGLTPGMADVMSFAFGPRFDKIIDRNTMTPETMSALSELSDMIGQGTVPDLNALPESIMSINDTTLGLLPGVGLPSGGGGQGPAPGSGNDAPGMGGPGSPGGMQSTSGPVGGSGGGGSSGGSSGGAGSAGSGTGEGGSASGAGAGPHGGGDGGGSGGSGGSGGGGQGDGPNGER